MSTPILFIVIPILLALLLALLQTKRILSTILGTVFAIILALLAVFLPDNLIIEIGNFTIEITDSLNILGRSLVIEASNLPFVSLMFLITGLWIIGSGWFTLSNWFRSLAMVIAAILIAALSVEPFLYAALLIELAVLLSIPMLSPKGEAVSTGVLRFLIFQTLALPIILLSGWMLSGIEAAPANSPLISRASVLLILGFTFWLAIFPFHSWLPMISQTSHPWIVSFIVVIMPTTLLMFALTFIDRYTWLRSIPQLYDTLRMLGILMIVVGGVLIAIQQHLGRAFGYCVIVETGFSIMAIGLTPQGGLDYFSMFFLPRIFGYWLWVFALSSLNDQVKDLSFNATLGIMRVYPFIGAGIILGQLSIAGLPMLASFPVKRMVWFLAADQPLSIAFWIFIGSMGLFIFSMRALLHFITPKDGDDQVWKIGEHTRIILPVCLAFLVLVFMGVFPQWFLQPMTHLMDAFLRLR